MSPDPTDQTDTGKIEDRLAELGLRLPGPYPPHDPLDAVVVHGGRAARRVSCRAVTTGDSCIPESSARPSTSSRAPSARCGAR